MSRSLSTSLTTEQPYGICAQAPQQKCVWVCYVQIYKELDSSYTVILCKLTTYIPNGLKLLNRETGNCTTFLLLITSFMQTAYIRLNSPSSNSIFGLEAELQALWEMSGLLGPDSVMVSPACRLLPWPSHVRT